MEIIFQYLEKNKTKTKKKLGYILKKKSIIYTTN